MEIIWKKLENLFFNKTREIKYGTNGYVGVRLDSQHNTIITVLHLYLGILFHVI